jgi:PAS domain S-box-containing protein
MVTLLKKTPTSLGLKILLVEDSLDQAELIEQFLLNNNLALQFSITRTERISTAQQILKQESFDAILLDLELPDSQGINTVTQLKKYSFNTPIVVLTAQSDQKIAIQSIQLGAQDYLVKIQITSEILIRSLRYAIERQQSQEALRKSEEKYRSVVENSLFGIAIITPPNDQHHQESASIEVNEALCNLLGYSHDELIKKSWLELIHPENIGADLERFSQVLTGKNEGWIADQKLLHKNGKIVYARVSVRPVRNSLGVIEYLIKIVLDVSDRYLFESQLKASEEFLNHIIDANPDPLFVKDEEHRWMILNKAFCELIGKSSSELIGKSESDFLAQEKAEILREKDELIFKTAVANETEELFTDSQGKSYLISTKKNVFEQADGKKFLIGRIREISEQHQAEKNQQSHDFYFHKLAFNTNILGIVYQSQLSSDGLISFPYISAGIYDILGYTPAEIQQIGNQSLRDLMHPEDLVRMPAYIKQIENSGDSEIFEIEYRIKHRNGTWRWLCSRDTAFARTSEGQLIKTLGTATDITEQKQKEIEIRLLLAATEAINRSLNFQDSLKVILELFCVNISWDFAEAWIPNAAGTFLKSSDEWYTKDRSLEQFGHLSKNFQYPLGVGLPGRIWATGKSEWIADISQSELPTFLRSQLANQMGLKACFGVPICADREVLAVLVFFNRIKIPQQPRLAILVKAAAAQLSSHIQHKKAETALRKSEERFHLAMEISALGLWDWNVNTGKIYFDSQWKTMLGYKNDEIENSLESWEKLLHPEDKENTIAARNTHLKGETEFYKAEYRMLSKFGNWQWISDCGKVTDRDQMGTPLRMIGTHKDISDSKLLEEKLRNSYTEMNALFAAMTDIILIIDTDKNNIKVAPTNPNQFYPSGTDTVTSTLEVFFKAPKREIFFSKIRQAIETKTTVDFEYSLVANQQKLYFLATISPVSENLVIWVARDISDRKKIELALQSAKESAEAANRAKSEFIANMSHELRTPLNGILGYVQLIKHDTNISEDQQESLSNIEHCGAHLLTLIEDILDISKIEAMKMELMPVEFNLPHFVKTINELFQMRAMQKNISFIPKQISPLPTCIVADNKRLRQVLINLLDNAIKFTNSGSVTFKFGSVESGDWDALNEEFKLDITSEKAEISELNHPSRIVNCQFPITQIRFQIEDTGIGIEATKLKEIFLPFNQVNNHDYSLGGTGLGLSISYKLVKIMGGEIRVQSSLGKGSIFLVDLALPLAGNACELAPLPEKDRIIGFTGHKRKVLIVDDNNINRAMLARLLSRIGFEIIEAENGKDCLKKAVEFLPDVILMDLMMPVMDGFEATRSLRMLPELQKVIVLALSASIFENTQPETLLPGCDQFLCKPVEASQLLERLRIHLDLEWIYEEPQEIIMNKEQSSITIETLAAITPPDSESIAALLKLAVIGDIEAILEETTILEKTEPKFLPFVSHLQQLAKGFHLKKIREFLKQCQSKS